MGLVRLYSNILRLKNDLSTILISTFNERGIKELIIELNTEKQLFAKGVGVDGQIVGYYSLTTELISRGRKRFNSPYNFKDTGQMFRSFRVMLDRDGFTIDADADKLVDSNIIENEAQILGLTNESKIELVKEILPILASKIRAEITR
jgi:hypothetical protein